MFTVSITTQEKDSDSMIANTYFSIKQDCDRFLEVVAKTLRKYKGLKIKLTMDYDNISNEIVSNGKAFSYVKNLAIAVEKHSVPVEIIVGFLLVIDQVNLLLVEGVLSHEDILIKFREEELRVHKNGDLLYWPKGFHNYHDSFLNRLSGIPINRRRLTVKP